MSSGQQIIKVLAIIFAIFLIVNIFGWIIFGLSTFVGINMLGDNISREKYNTIEFSQVYQENVENIKVETAISKLTIKIGDELKVEGTKLPSKFSSKVRGNTLTVKEEGSKGLFHQDVTSELIITVPSELTLEKLEVDAGIGNNTIEDIVVENLELTCGVGVMKINNLTSLSKTKITGGAGRVVIEDSKLKTLDLEAGVGEMIVSADVTGNSKVECGVGRLEVNLLRPQEDYSIKTQTGLGKMDINGKRCRDDEVYGTGTEKLKVEGGIGAVEITTLDN